MRNFEENTLYRHFKGNYYLLESIAENANTNEVMVVYRALYGDNKVWVRELNDFASAVDMNRADNVTHQQYRFERVISIE